MDFNFKHEKNEENNTIFIIDELYKNIKNYTDKEILHSYSNKLNIIDTSINKQNIFNNTISPLSKLKMRISQNKVNNKTLDNYIENIINKDIRYHNYKKIQEKIQKRNVACVIITEINFSLDDKKMNRKSIHYRFTNKEYLETVAQINKKTNNKTKNKQYIIREDEASFSDDSIDYSIMPIEFKNHHKELDAILHDTKNSKDLQKIIKNKTFSKNKQILVKDFKTVMSMIKLLNIN